MWTPLDEKRYKYPWDLPPNLLKQYVQKRNADIVYNPEKEWDPVHNKAMKKLLWKTLAVHPVIARVGDEILKFLGNNFGCLHARVERDGTKHWIRPPGVYSWEMMSKKFQLSKLNDSFGLDKLDTLYIATGELQNFSPRYFSTMFPRVFHKWDFALPKSFEGSYSVLSALDFYICNKSAIFIGNNHSKWSGNLALLRLLR